MKEERANGKRRSANGVPTELYTTEASESRKQAVDEQVVADPTAEEGEKAISEHVIEEDDGEVD